MLIKTFVPSLSFALSIGVAAGKCHPGRSSRAVTCSRPNSRWTAGEMTRSDSGVVVSSRGPITSTTRLCADLGWRWME